MPKKLVHVDVFEDGTVAGRAMTAISDARFMSGATTVLALYASREDARILGQSVMGVPVRVGRLVSNTFDVEVEA